MLDYANAGVSTELGDDASRILYLAAKETWKNRKGMLGEIIVPFDDFTGLRYVKVSSLPKGTVMGGGADGIGTKIEVHERMQDHKTAAYNLICMIADDAVVRGAEPVLALTVFDVNSLGTPLNPRSKEMSEIASGYVEACRLAGIAIINGEVAEIGNRVGGFGSFKYNWGGSCIWFAKEERLLTGREVKPGQSIVGLREPGLRSNGFSLLRKILKRSIGNYWHHKNLGSSSLGSAALQPSVIYSKAVVDMLGGIDKKPKASVSGIAHITGGGLPGKVGRLLKPSGCGADLTDLFEPCNLMHYCQMLGKVPDDEAYKTWNMGQGMVITTPNPQDVINAAQKHGIEAKIVGLVTKEQGIRIISRGYFAKEKILNY